MAGRIRVPLKRQGNQERKKNEALDFKYWQYLTAANAGGLGFPGGAVVESLPADAGDTGSSPGLGRSHMPRSSWAREPQLLSLRFWSLCSATREAAIMRGPCTAMKSGPCLPQLEKALAQKRRSNTAIKNKLIKTNTHTQKKNNSISKLKKKCRRI